MAKEETKAGQVRGFDPLEESLPKPKEMDKSENSLSPSRRIEQGDHQLIKSARAEMGEVKEENERLKMRLERVRRDYDTLQMQFFDIIKQDGDGKQQQQSVNYAREPEESDQLVSLSLGWKKKDEKISKLDDHRITNKDDQQEDLALSLDCKVGPAKKGNTSRENSSEDHKEEAGEAWPPSQVLKTTTRSGDDEASQLNPTKKARVCVRARCDTPTMNDGCQWRKYGQKIAKGNPCPRAYYRCTAAPSCPVRKQVQRCADDMAILITTYEGTHNHPLPVSATAMASTTSAAASMLLSRSSTSGISGQCHPAPAATSIDLHGLNFYLSDPLRSKQQFYGHLPGSMSAAGLSPPHPMITLDLTSILPRSSSSVASPYNSNYYNAIAGYNSSSSSTISWSNDLFNHGTTSHHQPFSKSNLGESFHHHLPFLDKANITPNQQDSSIAAATKAITADPNFQSALATALKSIISSGSSSSATANSTGMTTVGSSHGSAGGDVLGRKLGWNETVAASSGSIFGQGAAGQVVPCGSSYLNKLDHSMNTPSQPSRTSPISLRFASSKLNVAATSLGDHRDPSSL
ncbi:hypothetical protein SAY87_021712 [Trapa incisa]|uniref:WRKY domain-containing protein n=1 Tax=Trapa incisa TaxID=236973 RepID=A0AAN7PS47_9MYRT|nr:hypothetical protein SAY87_021712 [Trapa incisa]